MAKLSSGPTREILEAALLGLEAQKQKLDEQITQVRSMLGRRAGRPSKSAQSSIAGAVSGPMTETQAGLERGSAQAHSGGAEEALGGIPKNAGIVSRDRHTL